MFVIAFTRFIVIAQSTNAVFYISKSVFITVAAGPDGRHHPPNDESCLGRLAAKACSFLKCCSHYQHSQGVVNNDNTLTEECGAILINIYLSLIENSLSLFVMLSFIYIKINSRLLNKTQLIALLFLRLFYL